MSATYFIRSVCCQCKAEMGTKPTCDAAHHGRISHGYCAPCEQLAIKEAREAAATFHARQATRRAAQAAHA